MAEFFRMEFSEGEIEATELAITSNPAIEIYDGVFLNKDTDFVQLSQLVELNSEKQIIASVALRPDKWIERLTKTGESYYITFTPESVKAFKENFEKNGAIFNIEHTDRKVKAELIFSEIVGEVGEEKIREEFGYKGRLELNDYFVAVKIEDKEDWGYVKANKMNAFSIEAYFDKNKIEFKKEIKMTEKEMMEQIEALKAQLAEYKQKEEEVVVEVEMEETHEEEEVVAEVETEDIDETEVEESFLFTEEMYKDLIQKIAELEVAIEGQKEPEVQEKVEMNKEMSKPARFLRGYWM